MKDNYSTRVTEILTSGENVAQNIIELEMAASEKAEYLDLLKKLDIGKRISEAELSTLKDYLAAEKLVAAAKSAIINRLEEKIYFLERK